MIKYRLFYLHNPGTFLLSMERLHLIASWEQLLCDGWNSIEHAKRSDDAEVDIRTDGNDECSDRAINIILETIDNQVQDKVEEEDCYGIDSQPGWHSVASPFLLQISVPHFYKKNSEFLLNYISFAGLCINFYFTNLHFFQFDSWGTSRGRCHRRCWRCSCREWEAEVLEQSWTEEQRTLCEDQDRSSRGRMASSQSLTSCEHWGRDRWCWWCWSRLQCWGRDWWSYFS